MKGYIFLCDNNTENECLSRLLFGTNNTKIYESTFSKINVGDYLFLYNYDSGEIKGIFRALTRCDKNIEPDAWKDSNRRGYPWQVRVDDSMLFNSPLNRSQIEKLISFIPKNPIYPVSIIDEKNIYQLIEKFENINNTKIDTQIAMDLCSYYIFKCDKITGGRVFSENIFGAPSAIFRDIVSKIQENDYLFLWVIEERRLYGIWQASSRGQYNPNAFREVYGKYPAVVYTRRIKNIERGLDESTLRRIIPFDGSMPPYKITYDQGIRLIEILDNYSTGERYQEQPKEQDSLYYITDDGHRVKSQVEMIIDNFLFHYRIIHAYDYPIKGAPNRKCDFYLPVQNIYIEYWGMTGNRDYDNTRELKKNIYLSERHKLLELYPRDVKILPELLRAKLQGFGLKM